MFFNLNFIYNTCINNNYIFYHAILCSYLVVGKPSLFQLQSPLHSVELTETATLGCFALGYNVSYQWIIGSGSFPSKVTGINNSTLVISDVRLSDENTYTCVATTYKGCVLSNDTQLIVTGKVVVHSLTKTLNSYLM